MASDCHTVYVYQVWCWQLKSFITSESTDSETDDVTDDTTGSAITGMGNCVFLYFVVSIYIRIIGQSDILSVSRARQTGHNCAKHDTQAKLR